MKIFFSLLLLLASSVAYTDPLKPFLINDKGEFYFDSARCEYKILRQDLVIRLKEHETTKIKSFLIEFKDGRTVLGHIKSVNRTPKSVACFHSLAPAETENTPKRIEYRLLIIPSNDQTAQLNNCLKAVNQDVELANEIKKPEPSDPRERASRKNRIAAAKNNLYRLSTSSQIDYEPNTSSPIWSNKKVIRVVDGAGLVFHNGFGPEVGERITTKDFELQEQHKNCRPRQPHKFVPAPAKSASAPK